MEANNGLSNGTVIVIEGLKDASVQPPPNDSYTITNIPKQVFNISIYEQKYWIESETILTLLTIFGLYVFVCILRYTLKKKFKPTREIGGGKQGKRLYIMLILASGFAVLRMISDHVVAFTSSYNDMFCFATIAASTVLYAFGLLSVYIFLWMRQSIFYANPVLAKILNKAVTFISWFSLGLMLVTAACLTILYNMPSVNGWDYQVTPEGCKGVLKGDDEVLAAIVTTTISTFQIFLLVLFLYPLLSRKTQKYRSTGNTVDEHAGCRPSMSNTDENETDGDNSMSIQNNGKYKEQQHSTENESGVDVRGPADSPISSKSDSNKQAERITIKFCEKIEPIASGTETGGSNHNEQKGPGIFNPPKFPKPSQIFYRKHLKSVDSRPQGMERDSCSKKISNTLFVTTGKCTSREAQTSKEVEPTENKLKHRRVRRTHQGRRMMAYLKKSFCMMVICVFTDIASTVIQARLNLPETVYLVIFDLNLMINIICIVISFRDWNRILFPMCLSHEKKISSGKFSERLNTSGIEKGRSEALRSLTNIKAHPKISPRRCDVSVPCNATILKVKCTQMNLHGKT